MSGIPMLQTVWGCRWSRHGYRVPIPLRPLKQFLPVRAVLALVFRDPTPFAEADAHLEFFGL